MFGYRGQNRPIWVSWGRSLMIVSTSFGLPFAFGMEEREIEPRKRCVTFRRRGCVNHSPTCEAFAVSPRQRRIISHGFAHFVLCRELCAGGCETSKTNLWILGQSDKILWSTSGSMIPELSERYKFVTCWERLGLIRIVLKKGRF